ncbi:MAG: transketolase [Spirochaetales bacterium]|jgi:transketolase|nr:transketolase [Spirochaetales bacterium]
MTDTGTITSLKKTALQLRRNLLEMLGVGKVGHLGGSSSLAEIVAALYFHKMKVNRNNPKDENRDRFLLSKGHAVLIQYAALAELGYFPKSEFAKVKSLAGTLQGHPDMKIPGIEAVTGSLGQGLSIGVGMALALRLDKKPNRVYVIMGDGELSEGQLWEAAMAAWKFKVDNLTGIVDCNKLQATGPTSEIFEIPDIEKKWKAFGWNVIKINGHKMEEIVAALDAAGKVRGVPTVIIANTVKGKGFSFAEGKAAFHNGSLTEEQFRQAQADFDAAALAIEKEAAKSAVKKPAVKKAAEKKPAAKKPALKKAAEKKPIKKPVAKKTAVKKPSPKKTAAKKRG